MTLTHRYWEKFYTPGVALLFITISVVIFWRDNLFFYWEDWTSLRYMAQYPFGQMMTISEGEIWRPVSRLVYFLMVNVAREHYGFYMVFNSLFSGVCAFLLYLFLRRHFHPGLALGLGLLYAGLEVHYETIWESAYICYILGLGFFLMALLLTNRYLESPSAGKLWGLGVFALLSVLSHNFELLALAGLPLYALLLGNPGTRGRFWPLAGIIVLVYLAFVLTYVAFPGIANADTVITSDHWVSPNLLKARFYLWWLYVTFIAPFSFIFIPSHRMSWQTIVLEAAIAGLCLTIIFLWGSDRERRFGLWALLLNAMTLWLPTLARSHGPMNYAANACYAMFTVIWALVLVAMAANILARKLPAPRWIKIILLVGLLAVVLEGQFRQLTDAYQRHARIGRIAIEGLEEIARANPEKLSSAWGEQLFNPQVHYDLTRREAAAIKRYLNR